MQPTNDFNGAFTDDEYRDRAAFRHAMTGFFDAAEQRARQAGITPQQYVLLLSIRGHPSYPAVSIGTIATTLRRDPSSASTLVDAAVKRGLVERREDAGDRRKALVRLTAAGQRALDAVMEQNRSEMLALIDALVRQAQDWLSLTQTERVDQNQ